MSNVIENQWKELILCHMKNYLAVWAWMFACLGMYGLTWISSSPLCLPSNSLINFRAKELCRVPRISDKETLGKWKICRSRGGEWRCSFALHAVRLMFCPAHTQVLILAVIWPTCDAAKICGRDHAYITEGSPPLAVDRGVFFHLKWDRSDQTANLQGIIYPGFTWLHAESWAHTC